MFDHSTDEPFQCKKRTNPPYNLQQLDNRFPIQIPHCSLKLSFNDVEVLCIGFYLEMKAVPILYVSTKPGKYLNV